MATKPVSSDEAATASAVDLVEADAPAVLHDRAVTNVGSGRITFKGHNAAAGYPFRVYEGQVQALVDGAWVEAPDATALEG
jgi:hypothetical protein